MSKGILNPYLYYAFNNESHMAKFQAIICHRSFVEIKVLGLRYVAGAIHGKSLKSYTSDKLFYEANKQNEIIKWLYIEVSLVFKRCILFSCTYSYMQAVFNFITSIFTKVIIIIFAIFYMSWCHCSHRSPAIRDWSTTSR
jgi:hypothetical protein